MTVAAKTYEKTEKTHSGYLSLRETLKYLHVNKTEIERLVRGQRLTAYRLGGAHLRFCKDQLLIVKHELANTMETHSILENSKVSQFWAFNGFYIVTGALLSGILIYLLSA